MYVKMIAGIAKFYFAGTEIAPARFTIQALQPGGGTEIIPEGAATYYPDGDINDPHIETLARTGDMNGGPIKSPLYDGGYADYTYSIDFVEPENMVLFPPELFSLSYYYIQFPETGKVIQDNGESLRLTAETKLEADATDVDAQLWSISEDFETTGAGYYYYGTYSIVNKKTGNQLFYSGGGSVDANTAPVDGAGFYSWSGNAAYSLYPRKCDITLTATLKVPGYTGRAGYLLHGNWRTNSEAEILGYFLTPNADNKLVAASEGITANAVVDFISASGSGNGIYSPKGENSKVYPNPAVDFLSVELPEGAVSITLVNSLGQTLQKLKATAKIETLTLSSLAPGIYFLKIEKTSGVATTRFIKK
jgi:hypothetical protein